MVTAGSRGVGSATVHTDHLSGDVVRLVSGEESDQRGYVLGRANSEWTGHLACERSRFVLLKCQ